MARQNINVRLGIFVALAAVLLALPFSSTWAAQTIRPKLRLSKLSGNWRVSWTNAAYYYALVGKPDLGATGPWLTVAIASADFLQAYSYPRPGVRVLTNLFGRLGDEVVFPLALTNDQIVYGLEGPRAIPICQFAVFYDGLLEFVGSPAMSLKGPVHANSNIYGGTSAALTFLRTVTTTGSISAPEWGGLTNLSHTGDYFGDPESATNIFPLSVMAGTNRGTLHAVTNLHRLIEVPPVGESPNSTIGLARLYNQANVIVLVSNTSVSVTIQAAPNANQLPAADPSPIFFSTNLNLSTLTNVVPFLRTNSFFDQRELKTAKATQIDLGLYNTWLGSNDSVLAKFPPGAGSYPTILYVADNRTNASSTFSVVRLTNGAALPDNGGRGFTLATPNPLYVWGNYNCTNAAYLGTTNTSATVPSALICDALTILSASWRDSASAGSLFGRTAAPTDTVNAAIIAGDVPSIGPGVNEYSGGVHNLPRLLENWGGSTLWLNTSFVCLYASTIATGQFLYPGVYYNSPNRQFKFDLNFTNLSRIPPGCPIVGVPAPGN